jgi:hypothetical protein
VTDEPRERARRLERRLTEASEAAERLISEAARAARPGQPPPAGWQAPDEPVSGARPGAAELDTVMQAIKVVRELVPPEVTERVVAAIREVLLALRALIDYYLERLESKPQGPVEVQDIPIR